jgi:hypothetical protein
MIYTVTIEVTWSGKPDLLIRETINAESSLEALGILLRKAQQIPKALDAVNPKHPYRDSS